MILVADGPVSQALKNNLALEKTISIAPSAPILQRWIQKPFDLINLILHRAYFLVRETRKLLQARQAMPTPSLTQRPVTVLISWLTPENVEMGEDFHKSFFGNLADQLRQMDHQVAIAPIVLHDIHYPEALKRLRSSSLPILMPHRFIRFLDLIKAAIRSCVPTTIPHSFDIFANMDISSLTYGALRRDWISNSVADAILIIYLIRRWAATGISVNRFIYIYENQPSEKSLCWQVKQSFPEAMLIGYQHAGIPKFLLNFYLAKGESNIAPLPNRIVTVGSHNARILLKNGYDPATISEGGALHLEGVLKQSSVPKHLVNKETTPTVLIAPSDSLEETMELAFIAANLFEEDEGTRVILKCHPRMPFERIHKLQGIQLPKHVRVSEKSIYDLIPMCSVMLYAGSTVAFQAIALGIPVIHVVPKFEFNLDPLETPPNLRMEAAGIRDLRNKVKWLLERRQEYIDQHTKAWQATVDQMYSPVTEQTYHAFLT